MGMMYVDVILGKDKDGLWTESFVLPGNRFAGSKVDCKDGVVYNTIDNTWKSLTDTREFQYLLDNEHYNDACKYGWDRASVERAFKAMKVK